MSAQSQVKSKSRKTKGKARKTTGQARDAVRSIGQVPDGVVL
jgi:uncharacterized protein YjbJ (UPF0337 family)